MEGSTLTLKQTAQIFNTGTFTMDGTERVSIDDAIETRNHFIAFRWILDHADEPVDKDLVCHLHAILKNGTRQADEPVYNVGGYKTEPNIIGDMSENAQTMTEFTFAPGEKNIVGDRFSPSVIIFWLKTSIAASSTRIQYKAPNTLFGLIPLGASTKTIPLRNVASVDTDTKFNLGSLVWGLLFLFVGFGMFDSNAMVAIILLLIAAANLANVMSASLVFRDPSGGANAITVSVLEKDRLMGLAQEILALVFTDADQLRHEESMHMAEKQYEAQTNSVLIQQRMLASQQDRPVQAPASTGPDTEPARTPEPNEKEPHADTDPQDRHTI